MESPAVQKNKTECKMAIRNEEPHVNKCFPRARGDVPHCVRVRYRTCVFSPRTRGCSASLLMLSIPRLVFPAHAGMFREKNKKKILTSCFPRARGDVPFFFNDFYLIN